MYCIHFIPGPDHNIQYINTKASTAPSGNFIIIQNTISIAAPGLIIIRNTIEQTQKEILGTEPIQFPLKIA